MGPVGAQSDRTGLRPREDTGVLLSGEPQWRVTELTGCQGPPGPPVPSPPLQGERGAQVADGSRGRARPSYLGADRLCPTQWEKSQLDEDFMHSEENVCGCAKYECGERGGRARVSEPWVGRGGSWALGDCGRPAHPSSEGCRMSEPRAGGDAARPDGGGALGRWRVPHLPLH